MANDTSWKQSEDWLSKSPDHRLQGILDKLSTLDKMNQCLNTLLEPTLIGHCRIANIQDGCMLIEADSPTWATPLQYQLPTLLKKFREAHPYLVFKKIDCYVKKPNIPTVKKSSSHSLTISPENAETLACIAEQISNPKLKKILAQIAGHGVTLRV